MDNTAKNTAASGLPMFPQNGIFVGKGDSVQLLDLNYANRHGLIAGATGTGKTVTLQSMAEAFSQAGVPVFLADVKGDLSGISMAGGGNAKVDARVAQLGIGDYTPIAAPTIFWDVFGKQGHPLRTTISEMGPVLLSRILNLSEAQEGAMQIAFRVADEEGMLMLDMKDLHAMLTHLETHAKELTQYGLVSKPSIAAIRRSLLALEAEGAETFFAEPALNIADLMRTDRSGRGFVNVLAADALIQSPKLYATFLLWLLSELFENLPEAGDLPKPKLVFFFDEAHLLFEDAPKALIDKVEQVVRLIRSKGVGVYFVTQNPQDIPEDILGQLGNRVQHALRAFTPKDQKAVKVAAQTFRANPRFKTETAITELGVGEALVSLLEKGGVPSVVERSFIRPPASRIGALTPAERASVMHQSPISGIYDRVIDRESAYEMLQRRAAEVIEENTATPTSAPIPSPWGGTAHTKRQTVPQSPPPMPTSTRTASPRASNRQSYGEAVTKSVLRSVGSTVGRQIANQLVRGIMGSLLKR